MEVYNDELGQEIKLARNEKQLSIEQLSLMSGVDSETIEKYEEGLIEDIDRTTIERLAKVLEIDLSSLTNFRGKTLGEIIKFRRKELGMTQKDVADHVSVSHSAVSRWESGEIENITQDKIAGLADILKLSPLTLIEPGGEKNIYTVNQEYLDIARRIQSLDIPIEVCHQLIDIFKQLKEKNY